MKRKQLSMKQLTQYVADYLLEVKIQNPKLEEESIEYELNILKSFIDYIWKNPK